MTGEEAVEPWKIVAVKTELIKLKRNLTKFGAEHPDVEGETVKDTQRELDWLISVLEDQGAAT